MIIQSGKLLERYQCGKMRSHEKTMAMLNRGKKISLVYEKASYIKDTVKKGVLFGEKVSVSEMQKKFLDFGYPTEETAFRNAADAYRQIYRYVNSEQRKPQKASVKTVFPYGLFGVEVRPDFVFFGYKEFGHFYVDEKGRKKTYFTTEPYLEVVILRCGLPDVTARGNKNDHCAAKRKELYAMLCYGMEYAKENGMAAQNLQVEASYYFLRKKSDNYKEMEFDPDFFEGKGGGNIISIHDYYHDNTSLSEIDTVYKPQFERFLKGDSACETDCEKCDFYNLCNFTLPPKYIEKEMKQKSLSDLTLTDAQEEIIGFRQGYGRVNAGAGTGKTMCTALRTAYLLDEGVEPEKICLLTFTITGAEEMTDRIKLYAEDLGYEGDVSKITSTTFNSFGYEIVRDNYMELGYGAPPTLIDDIDRAAIIKEILRKYPVEELDYKNFKMNMPNCKGALPVTQLAFDIIKRKNLSVGDEDVLYEEMVNLVSKDTCKRLIELYEVYDRELFSHNLIEYADQELLVFRVLRDNPYYLSDTYGFEHIFIDEFQDCNEIQFELMKQLIDSPTFQSLLIVGDDSQSIFGFRGSTPEYIIQFEEKLGKKVQDFYLLENHRSTPEIIDFANKINANNLHRVMKDLVPTRDPGTYVRVNGFWKQEDEDKYVVNVFKQKLKEGYSYEDMAYIASKRTELMKMGTVLTENNIPWIMLNPEPVLQNSRVVAAIGLVRYITDNTDTVGACSYLDALNKNQLLEKEDSEILNMLKKLDESVTAMALRSPAEKLESLKYMLSLLKDEDEIYDSFLDALFMRKSYYDVLEYALNYEEYGENQDKKRERHYPGIVLTTAHSSKGMEWKVVVDEISSYHQKSLPANLKRYNTSEVEEKRRLLFVSATRARDELHVIGQYKAYGCKPRTKKEEDTRVYNGFLEESYEAVGKVFSTINPYDED